MARNQADEREMRSGSKRSGEAESNKSFLEQIFRHFYKVVSYVGFEVLKVIKNIYDGERSLSAMTAKKLGPVLQRFCDAVSGKLRAAGQAFLHPFRMTVRGVCLIRKSAAEARKESRAVLPAVWKTVRGGAKRNKWFFRGLLNYGAAAFGVAVVCVAVGYMTNLHYVVAVEYNGQSIGYIANETVYEEASRLLQERIVYENGEAKLDTSPTFSLAIASKSELRSEEELVNDMIRSASDDIVESKGVYIDGKFYGAVEDDSTIEAAVNEILSKYKTGNANETVELTKPVEVKEGLYLTATVIDPQEIVDLLHSEVEGETLYTIQAGDTPSEVAKKHGLSYADFKAMNPNCEKSFVVGKTVYLSKSEPFMSVKVIRRETYKTETMYETETISDKTKSISYSKVTQKGVKGISEITADVQYVNGVEVGRNIIETKVLQKVVNQKITKGTKMPSSASSTAVTATGSGSLSGLKFMWPVNGGYVSSPFGGRRNHKGVDIAAPKGTAIYAAEDGTVTMSRWYTTYGNCIIINHGNGIQTLYGHASKLVVKQGQKVKKGDLIALVGSTGRSTGNHLHFEIQRNGTRINPIGYIR